MEEIKEKEILGDNPFLTPHLPFHDYEQTLSSLVEVFIDVYDLYNMGALRGPPVEFNFSAGFRAVLQHLTGR